MEMRWWARKSRGGMGRWVRGPCGVLFCLIVPPGRSDERTSSSRLLMAWQRLLLLPIFNFPFFFPPNFIIIIKKNIRIK